MRPEGGLRSPASRWPWPWPMGPWLSCFSTAGSVTQQEGVVKVPTPDLQPCPHSAWPHRLTVTTEAWLPCPVTPKGASACWGHPCIGRQSRGRAGTAVHGNRLTPLHCHLSPGHCWPSCVHGHPASPLNLTRPQRLTSAHPAGSQAPQHSGCHKDPQELPTG